MRLHCILFIRMLSTFSQTPIPTLRDYMYSCCAGTSYLHQNNNTIYKRKKKQRSYKTLRILFEIIYSYSFVLF